MNHSWRGHSGAKLRLNRRFAADRDGTSPHGTRSTGHVIDSSVFTGPARAMRTAVKVGPHLNAVTDDATIAVLANRREHVDRAFERIERVRLPAEDDVKGMFVAISAVFTGFHGSFW
jgi:hypothetical protein